MEKFSDEILLKKVGAALRDIEKLSAELGVDERYELKYDNREQLESECIKYTDIAKELKKKVEKIKKERKELEEKEERLKMQEENEKKEALELELKNKLLYDKELFGRLKFRFFNHSVYSPDDPEGLDPISSPPFFETKIEQFTHELSQYNYQLYEATYTEEDMSDRPEYMQKNLNIGFAESIKEHTDFFFICFRTTIQYQKCIYNSYWISNSKEEPSTQFDKFTFTKVNDINTFVQNFQPSNNNPISEIYTR